ncbi:MAG: 3-methyl-2-oxobutanoate hydroxymethyltransferase [Gammaproteobacteria bacterium]
MYATPTSSEEGGHPVTVVSLTKMKQAGEKIACLTAYDASFATVVDRCGVDLVLVGDSLGMVIQGHSTTIPVSVDDMIYHTKAVARAVRRGFLVADMPFMSYPDGPRALENAARLMQEGGASMVKLEGGVGQLEVVDYLARRSIPVCAHLGLQPQAVHKIGGYKVQGRDPEAAVTMRKNAMALEEAGADIVLLECVPKELAASIASSAAVPVIGIGAGPDVDGQILVLYDVLNIGVGHRARFVRNFMEDAASIDEAILAYVGAVKDGSYPAPEHCYT